MTAIATNREVQKRLCKALGLNPAHVRSVEIMMLPGEILYADVTLFVQDDQFELICLELEQCNFVEKEK